MIWGDKMSNFIWYVLAVVLIGIGVALYNYFKSLKYIRENINRQYGKVIEIKEKKINFDSVKSYFKNRMPKLDFYIDDITWDDLNMDEIFLSMNNTQTSIGEERLYDILREPLFDERQLKERDDIIEFFDKEDEKRFDVQYILGKLGKNDKACISDYLFNPTGTDSNRLNFYRILSAMPIITLVLCYFKIYLLVLFLASIAVNIYINYIVKKKSSFRFEDYGYIVSMVNCCKQISKLNIEIIDRSYKDIGTNLNKVKGIMNKYIDMNVTGTMNEGMILSEYLKILFLTEVRKYEKISNVIRNNSEALLHIYDYVGTIDSMIAVASYRRTLEFYSKPQLHYYKDADDKSVSFKEIYHPLIKNPVVNSCDIVKPILLTGSNASGKSTFLKVIAISSLTAQTIYTTFAKEYVSCFVRLYTSMALKDNLFNNESYFIVEIKSLKRIIDGLREDMPCLCFIDEILRGTNTVERISASSEVLNYFANSNCVCVAATHDVELTNILDKNFENYHFEEKVEDNNITFDYKLHNGRAETRNAIKLLSFMGYSKEIIDRAEERAESFMKTNNWEKI